MNLFSTVPSARVFVRTRTDADVRDDADVLQKIALHAARPGAEAVVIEFDLAEDLGVLPAQRLAAAGEIIEHVVESPRSSRRNG